MNETFEGRTFRLIHEQKEKLKQVPENSPEATEIIERIKSLTEQLLEFNKKIILNK